MQCQGRLLDFSRKLSLLADKNTAIVPGFVLQCSVHISIKRLQHQCWHIHVFGVLQTCVTKNLGNKVRLHKTSFIVLPLHFDSQIVIDLPLVGDILSCGPDVPDVPDDSLYISVIGCKEEPVINIDKKQRW